MSIIIKMVLFPSDKSSGTLTQYQFSLTCGMTFQCYNPTCRIFSSIILSGYLQYQCMKRLKQIHPLVLFIIGLKFLLIFMQQSKLNPPEIFVTVRELLTGLEPRVVDSMEYHQIALV